MIIEVERLARRFGPIEAVKGVSFEVRPGEIFGFLGPNGAGKTTTINMLLLMGVFAVFLLSAAVWAFRRQE